MGNIIDTVGTTVEDYARLTYWLNDKNEYAIDVNNPIGLGASLFSLNEKPYLGSGQMSLTALVNFCEKGAFDKRQVIDVSIGDGTLTVTKINKIDERDYVLTFKTEMGTQYQYVVRDCNHYNHAFNRFAKRVRESINPILGTTLVAVDAREPELDISRFPAKNSNVTTTQHNLIYRWAQETGNRAPSPNCACAWCQGLYQAFLDAHTKQPVVVDEVTQPKVTVEEVVNLVQDIVQENIVDNTYELYQSTYAVKPFLVCGHTDALWLMRKAMELQTVLDDMTPNMVFEVRDAKGVTQIEITGDTVRIKP